MGYPIICLGCGDRGEVNKITAGLQHACGGEVDIWTGSTSQRRLAARAGSFASWMGHTGASEGQESSPGSNEYAGNMPGLNPRHNREGRILCPVCHGDKVDIQDNGVACRECGGDGYITPTTTPRSPEVARHTYQPSGPTSQRDRQTKVPFVGRRRTAASEKGHQDLEWKRRTFGTALTSLGRAGYGAQLRTAMITDHAFDDPEGWKMNEKGFTPVRHAIEGARAFANEKGLRDPHAHDFSKIMQSKDVVGAVAKHYDQLPDDDPSAHPHFHAMRQEVAQQHDFATKKMGIKYESVDHDPYANVHEMVHDVNNNKRLKVMSTAVTGGHPFFSNEENDKFRFVHDLFGHAATGRNFDRHGEEAAYRAHSMMFSEHARPAMAAETRGQNSSLIKNGDFGPQKIGILPAHLHGGIEVPRHAVRNRMIRTVARANPGLSGAEVAQLVDYTMERYPEVR